MANPQEIILSDPSDVFLRYKARVERRIGREIRYYDIDTHLDPQFRTLASHYDRRLTIVCPFCVIWINRKQFSNAEEAEGVFAHEATHAELDIAEKFPFITRGTCTESEFQVLQYLSSFLSDQVVEERLRAFGFDRSDYFCKSLKKFIRCIRQRIPPFDFSFKEHHLDLVYGIYHAMIHICPHYLGKDIKTLDAIYEDNYPRALEISLDLRAVVHSEDIETASGFQQAFESCANILGLCRTFRWDTFGHVRELLGRR